MSLLPILRPLLFLCTAGLVLADQLPHRAPPVGFITRSTLTESELGAEQKVQFVLKLRHFDELSIRVQRGEVVPVRELIDRYCPTADSWQTVARWAQGNGYKVDAEEATHLAVIARAPLLGVQRTLAVRFSRMVGSDGNEYSSTPDHPTLPPLVREHVVDVYGLKNHLRAYRSQTTPITVANGQYLRPETLRQLYAANDPGMDGEGQTIVILGSNQVSKSDLTAFWSQSGLPTTLDQFTQIDPDPLNPPTENGIVEATMDIEAASAMAPKAKILYITGGYGGPQNAMFLINRQVSDPGIHQLSLSAGLPESACGAGEPAGSQYYALLAAAGITTFASSGDSGSGGNRVPMGGYYDPGASPSAEYPASDPFVTAVGGTSVQLTWDGGYVLPATEGGWTLPDPAITMPGKAPNESFAASGGGISAYYARPAWQKGPGLPAGNRRCVPDVAAMATGSPPFFIIYKGAATAGGGTSLSSPLWAGLCALLNQARAKAGLGPVGLLGPHVYPLIGTAAFRQMTVGSMGWGPFTSTANNGAYGVGANYNLVTGLGSPNLREIARALTTGAEAGSPPLITSQPQDLTVNAGTSLTLAATAVGPALTYQWYFNRIRTYPINIDYQHDLGEPIEGATAPSYTISAAKRENGGWYTVMVANGAGAVFSTHASVTVNFAPIITTEPTSCSLSAGEPLLLNVAAAAVPNATFQWYHDGRAIAGATSPSYSQANADQSSAGQYSVTVTNAIGSTNSNAAKVTVLTSASKEAYLFTTLAGGPGNLQGNVDGPASVARFRSPQKLAVDRLGNVYVTCSSVGSFPYVPAEAVRKVTPDGNVTTVAGAGVRGSADGKGTNAMFNNPQGIAVAPDGTLYVADMDNRSIRKITSDGQVTTFAGTAGQFGKADGLGAAASFEAPSALAFDLAGNLVVADQMAETIRLISPAGKVVTIAGGGGVSIDNDGVGMAAYFRVPSGLSVDAAGNIYVCDMQAGTIRKIAPGVIVTTLAGDTNAAQGWQDGTGAAARFFLPYDVAADASGNVFVADSVESIIRMITPAGVVTTIGGLAGYNGSVDGIGSAARFFSPRGIAVDGDGNLYIADSINGTIRKGIPIATTAFTTQPQASTVELGRPFTLTAAATGKPRPTYQWLLNGTAIPGATTATYQIATATISDAGTYTVTATNRVNSLTSSPATVTVFGAPVISSGPASLTVEAGHEARLSVSAAAAPAPSYQWYFEGKAIAGATDAEYRIGSAQPANSGSYSVEILNQYGRVTSSAALLAVHALGAPSIARQPQPQTIQIGSSVALVVEAESPAAVATVSSSIGRPTQATGMATSFQWYHDGNPVPGATDAMLLKKPTNSADAGTYVCLVKNLAGTTLSTGAVLSVVSSNAPGKLINQSVLTRADGMVTLGFVIGGPNRAPQRLLLRAVGPSLTSFGVADILSDPVLTLIEQNTKTTIGMNAGWSDNQDEITAVGASVGAFPLGPNSPDAALLTTIPTSDGGYTVQITNKAASAGNVLVELYDTTLSQDPRATRLLNLSCRYQLPANATLTTGFVISGGTSKTLLIRACGPALAPFGVGNIMPDPRISSVQPLNSTTVVAANTRWAGRRQIVDVAKAVGAFPFSDETSGDSALVVTLPPGAYTAQVSSATGSAGNVLVEVYEVP